MRSEGSKAAPEALVPGTNLRLEDSRLQPGFPVKEHTLATLSVINWHKGNWRTVLLSSKLVRRASIMPADLVPNAEIPELAGKVSPKMLEVLRRVQKSSYILNNTTLDRDTVAILGDLGKLGLVDIGYEGDRRDQPYMWLSNGNGARVLGFKTGIRGGPHYELSAGSLAAWIEAQGADRWWTVDGDPLLTGRLTFPCPGDELAAEFRKINRNLLVQAKKDDTAADGRGIEQEGLDALVGRLGDSISTTGNQPPPPSARDRILYLCWKGASDEWLLAEDSETSKQMAEDARQPVDIVDAVKE